MGYGYAGNILKVDLTTREIEVLATAEYEEWGGGHGIGSKLFWDLCEDKTVSGFDPGNVVTVSASPLSGTLVPSSGRCEVQGIGVQSYPTEWFTRSNFGGRFAGMLKMAGWDSIAVVGKADSPVWLDIRDGDVTIRDASETGDGLWGLDTYETQEKIWDLMHADGGWSTGTVRDAGRTTQRSAVLTIGAAGEHLTRIAALIHDGGSGAGQGGFGGVWGAKNLKAISVIGTGGVEVADPAALFQARIWAKDGFGFDLADPKSFEMAPLAGVFGGAPGGGKLGQSPGTAERPEGCMSCHKSCHGSRAVSGVGNGSHCFDPWYRDYEMQLTGQVTSEVTGRMTDLTQRYGVNTWMTSVYTMWLGKLAAEGLVGPGLLVDTDLYQLPVGSLEWGEEFLRRICTRDEIGDLLAEGPARAAEALGRYEQDTTSGILPLQEWGYVHHYDARTEAEWGYGSILGSRDVNEHDFNWCCFWLPTLYSIYGAPYPIEAAQMAEVIGAKLPPYNDPMMIDYSDEGIYSDAMVKTVSWHRAYGHYYKESMGLCDWAYADFINPNDPEFRGLTPDAEPKFVNAVLGTDMTFEDGIEIGRRIWNLDRAIWVLQGRHRDQEVYTEYNYTMPAIPGYSMYEPPYFMPTFVDGEWAYRSVAGRILDKGRVEDWKTRYYEHEGWDPQTGWPTRETLEAADLAFAAEALAAVGKLGGTS